jgi:hypothetical protein
VAANVTAERSQVIPLRRAAPTRIKQARPKNVTHAALFKRFENFLHLLGLA